VQERLRELLHRLQCEHRIIIIIIIIGVINVTIIIIDINTRIIISIICSAG
jgi:hypothetical protein